MTPLPPINETKIEKKPVAFAKVNLTDDLIAMSPTRVNKDPVLLQTGEPQKKKVIAAKKTPSLLPMPEKASKEEKIVEKAPEKPLLLRTDTAVPEPVKTAEKKEPAKYTDSKIKTVDLKNPAEKPAVIQPKITAIQPSAKEKNESVLIPIKDIKNAPKEQKTALIEPAIQKNEIKPASGHQEEAKLDIPDETKIPEKITNAADKPIQLLKPDPKQKRKEEKLAKEAAAKAEAEIKAKEELEKNKESLKKIQIWEAKEGAGLKRMLTKWSEQARVKLIWNTKKSYELEMDMYVSGTFENALKTLFSMGVKNRPQHNFDKEKLELVISD